MIGHEASSQFVRYLPETAHPTSVDRANEIIDRVRTFFMINVFNGIKCTVYFLKISHVGKLVLNSTLIVTFSRMRNLIHFTPAETFLLLYPRKSGHVDYGYYDSYFD